MSLSQVEQETVHRLTRVLESTAWEYQQLDAYYEGAQRLAQLGLAIPPALHRFVTIVNWPRLAVDAVEERLDVEGFRYPGTDDRDDDLWRVWQANDLDEESQLAHLDALSMRRSYVCVGTNEDDESTPLITVESPWEMVSERDPRTRKVSAALKLYDVVHGVAQRGTLYLPNETVYLLRIPGIPGEWDDEDRDEHGMGEVPVVPLVNRARTHRRTGVSEMADIIPLTDAAARALTNLQVAQETHSVPQRYVLGATQGDFVDSAGNQLTAWETYFGAVWGMANEQAKVGQFQSSDLRNFETTLNIYARLSASVTGLPLRFFGSDTANPPSADGIRADESRLVKRCERKQRAFSGSWEQVMRFVRRFQTGEWDDNAKRLETLWRDPATPTRAQQTDAVVKLVQSGVLPVEAGWEELGFSATRRERLKALRAQESADPTLERIARDLTGGADAAPVLG